MTYLRRRSAWGFVAILLSSLAGLGASAPGAAADAALPQGFQDSVAFGGLDQPTAVRFAPNGMVFVAEKAGKIEVYSELGDETPELFKDLRTETYDHGDRGLLGLAIDPEFPTKPYIYALFTYDKVIGDPTVPKWGTPDHTGDFCPVVPANGADDCVVSGRLVRYTANVTKDGENHLHAVAGGEKPLIAEDWCQQFSSHSIGDLHFGPEGALYASGGDGANFTSADFGQFGNPANPCGDPPGGFGVALTAPTAEGGSLRSQDLRTPAPADPTGLNGTIIRIDPETGKGWPSNPDFASSDENAQRIVALGFRNPFRFTIDPQTDEIYSGSVGSSEFEEIDRFDPTSGSLYNSGWPCYEGVNPQFQFVKLALSLCESLYEETEEGGPGAASPPLFFYSHRQGVMPGDECSYASGSAISGLSFYEGNEFPAAYKGALFFSDSVRNCIYVMYPGSDGRPDPSKIASFMTGGSNYPGVDIQEGPDGSLYYVSLFGEGFTPGAIHRITYAPGAPRARLKANPQYAASLSHVFHLDASESTDPTGEPLEFEWDLDGNGSFETTGEETHDVTFSEAKNVVVSVRVTDEESLHSVAKLTLYPGDTPPVPTISSPLATYEWGVGDKIHLQGSAINSEGQPVEPLFLYWSTSILHCPTDPEHCHAHPLQVFPGVTHGDLIAPEHDYPSYIEITLIASDKRGLTATKTFKLNPRTVKVKLASDPPGVQLVAGLVSKPAPFDVTSVEGSQLVLSAPLTAVLNGTNYAWQGWSDGGERVHTIVASGAPQYKATYSILPTPPVQESPLPLPPPPPPPLVLHASLGKHPGKKTSKRSATFTFSASEAGSTFRCKLDAKPFKPCRSPITYKGLKPGRHVFKVMSVASDGARTSAPAAFSWKVR
jgi:glucose/arabinose dehydrogenase